MPLSSRKGRLQSKGSVVPPAVSEVSLRTGSVDLALSPALVEASPRTHLVDLIWIDESSVDAGTLLRLLCLLDEESVPEILLHRAYEPQKIWGPSGKIDVILVKASDFDERVFSLISDLERLKEAINRLKTLVYITSQPSAGYDQVLRVHPDIQRQVVEQLQDPLTWKSQALKLVCHAFPIHQTLEPL